jgi:hypothetical protein
MKILAHVSFRDRRAGARPKMTDERMDAAAENRSTGISRSTSFSLGTCRL